MAVRRYTREELFTLRSSPLVQKPEDLPAIEQWLEYVYADRESREKLRIPHSESTQAQNASGSNRTSQRAPQSKVAGAGAGDASPMGNFSTGLRPSLMSARSARQGGEYIICKCREFVARRLMIWTEDVSLGPPRSVFPSSRNVSKLSDFAGEKDGEGNGGEEQEAGRNRMAGDRFNRNKSMNDKEYDDRWSSVRERRNGGEDGQRPDNKHGRRDREQDGERRNGDSRWGGRGEERRQTGERTSWRDREQDKKERTWERGGRQEKAPEWMDESDPPPGAEDDLGSMGMPRNQEDFQKWKDAMSGKKAPVEVAEPEPPPARETKPAATLNIGGFMDKPLGVFGEGNTPSGSTMGSLATAPKSAQPTGKASRFASMFNKDPQPREEPAAQPKSTDTKPNGSAEDEVGFQRIMQMLGGTGIGPAAPAEAPSSPPAKTTGSGPRQKSRFNAFFDSAPKSPEMMQVPPDVASRVNDGELHLGGRGAASEPPQMFGGTEGRNEHQSARGFMPGNPISPDPIASSQREQQRQPPPPRANDVLLEQPPIRATATPDTSIHDLLASRPALRPEGHDKNSAFLLNLLQTKGSSRPPSQQARPDGNFPLWLDQPQNPQEPHAPKPRVPPPPGLFEDQLTRNALQDPLRQELTQQMPSDMPQRRTSQRAPPGFYDEQNLFLQQAQQAQAAQRRGYNEPAQQLPPGGRRMSGHPNLPQMQIPNLQQQYQHAPPQGLPDFMQSPVAQQGPPPGFNPHMPRHPPGIHNIPNIFQAPQQPPAPPQSQQGSREPPGFGGMAGLGGMQSPPNAPPGFYGGPQGLPPGFMHGVPASVGPNMRNARPFDGGFDNGPGLGGPGPRR